MKLEFEFTDGSSLIVNDCSYDDAWAEVRRIEHIGILEIKSAWRDDEPWFGMCTDMREGQP